MTRIEAVSRDPGYNRSRSELRKNCALPCSPGQYTVRMSLAPIGQFPAYRPRRLRQSAALRRLVCETRLDPAQLVLPLFVRPGRKVRRPIGSMPGVFQLSLDE